MGRTRKSLVEAPQSLTEASLQRGLKYLAEADPDLAKILSDYGEPPLWNHEPGFATLVRIMLSQQVSVASAQRTYEKLLDRVGTVTPEKFLELDDTVLKAVGFSHQKISYSRALARAIVDGEINLHALEKMDDEAVRAELMRFNGIGPWTAEIYLLRALGRTDAWPVGDLGLILAVESLKRLPSRPTASDLIEIADVWRPWRAVAARLLWHYYLKGRG
jgi:DNA-3-methyladenine glycosylase II